MEDTCAECVPPSVVFCLARGPEEAAVWWLIRADGKTVEEGVPARPADPVDVDLDALRGVTAWQLLRYRRDRSPPFEWRCKGSMTTSSERVTHALVTGLSTGFEYRFTVRALSGLQVGVESEPSNAALIDMPLPASWFRIPAPMDPIEATASIAAPRLYYYANIKTKQTSWERPEKDPYFVDDAVYGRFTRREHSFLRGLFDEEIANCGNVSIDGCRDMLLEAGERMTRKQLALLFKAYTGDALRARFRRLFTASLRSLFCCAVVPSSGLTIMSNRRERLGQWTLEYSELADRSFYRHSVTQATSWEMPDEVRFYVEPTKLFPKIIELIEFNNYQILIMMFSEVNRDCSGHISEQELRLIIARIGLFVPRQELHILFLDRDTDGLGMMAFNELVHLIVHLTTRDNGVALPLVREAFLDLERTHDLSVDEEKCSVGYFERDEMDSVYGSDAGRIIRFKERRRSSADHVIAESKDGDVSSDADEADSSANQTSKHSKSSCLSFVSMPWGRNRRRYQVTPDEGEQTNSEHVAEQLSNRRLHHAVSAQNLLDAEDSRLMNVDSSQHLTDCMCGCRKIVELFDS